MKKTFTTLAAVAAVTLGGAAQADVLRMAYSSAPRSVDPYPFGGATTAGYKEHIYEALVGHDDAPLLATGWTWNSPTSLTVHLREGVEFHNGQPFTARDVVYSACRMMFKIDGKRNLLTSSMGPLTDVVAVDDHSVRFEMANPYPLWIQKMKFLSILPASGADIPDGPIKYDAEGDCGVTAYPTRDNFENGDAAIGTGPFKHVSFDKEFAKMKRNDDYWGEASEWEFPFRSFAPVVVIAFHFGKFFVKADVLERTGTNRRIAVFKVVAGWVCSDTAIALSIVFDRTIRDIST